MAKQVRVWRVATTHPFKLCTCGPKDKSGETPAIPLDVDPGWLTGKGKIERTGVISIAYARPLRNNFMLQLVSNKNQPIEVERPVWWLSQVPESAVVYLPAPEYLEAFLVLPAAPAKKRDIPEDVIRYVVEMGRASPGADVGKLWAVAWSRWCKYKATAGDPHCKKAREQYLTG